MNLDKINIKGIVTLKRFDRDHNCLDKIVIENLVVDTGLEFIVKKLIDTTSETLSYIGIGNGQGATSASMVELLDDIQQTIDDPSFVHTVEKKIIRFKTTRNTNELLVESVFAEAEGTGFLISEVGLFTDTALDAYTPHRLVSRVLLDEPFRFEKNSDEYLSVAWNLIIG